MATLALPPPPIIDARSHLEYRSWLEHSCFDRACAYCMAFQRDVQVDHVEPAAYAPLRKLDPTNLLPSCEPCNGRAGKSDYHPGHSARTRLPNDTTGFAPLDPRSDDYGSLFEIEANGQIHPRPGASYTRAQWNITVLLKLDRRKLVEMRRETLELAEIAEILLSQLVEQGEDPQQLVTPTGEANDWPARKAIDCLARRLLMLEIFDIAVAPQLLQIATARRDVLRNAGP